MKVQTIEHDGKAAFVVVPVEQWNAILARLEERSDIDDAMRTLARIEGGDETYPMAFVERLMGREHPLRVWRDFRNFTLRALADAVGVSSAALSKIETGKSRPSTTTLLALARALHCDMDDLMPAPAGAARKRQRATRRAR
jgi:DNA-binding XRE family transcriptional regulator